MKKSIAIALLFLIACGTAHVEPVPPCPYALEAVVGVWETEAWSNVLYIMELREDGTGCTNMYRYCNRQNGWIYFDNPDSLVWRLVGTRLAVYIIPHWAVELHIPLMAGTLSDDGNTLIEQIFYDHWYTWTPSTFYDDNAENIMPAPIGPELEDTFCYDVSGPGRVLVRTNMHAEPCGFSERLTVVHGWMDVTILAGKRYAHRDAFAWYRVQFGEYVGYIRADDVMILEE